jgi:hypothetical protein
MCPTARCVSIAVALSMVLPPSVMAGQHVVERAEITARLQAAAAERSRNQQTLQRFLTSHLPAVAPGVDVRRVRAGVAALSDDDLRDLARRADALQVDPAAGGTRKTLIIVGVVVLAAVILAALIVSSCKEQGAECLN